MRERRIHERIPVDTEIRLYHDSFGALQGRIRNISASGVLVMLDESTVRVDCVAINCLHLRPVNVDFLFSMQPIRHTDEGIVLRFIDETID